MQSNIIEKNKFEVRSLQLNKDEIHKTVTPENCISIYCGGVATVTNSTTGVSERYGDQINAIRIGQGNFSIVCDTDVVNVLRVKKLNNDTITFKEVNIRKGEVYYLASAPLLFLYSGTFIDGTSTIKIPTVFTGSMKTLTAVDDVKGFLIE